MIRGGTIATAYTHVRAPVGPTVISPVAQVSLSVSRRKIGPVNPLPIKE
jgi:hypothetical protein